MKIFVIGLAALPFVISGGALKAADILTINPIVVAADDSMESTEPPFSDDNPGDEPFDSSAGAPNDESNMQMEPSDQEDMDNPKSDDSMPDDNSMDE